VSGKRVVLVVVVVLGALYAWGNVQWPRLNDVETGRTPEYPDLRVKEYSASPERVTKAARSAIESLPRWTLVGAGEGPGGGEIQAVATTKVFRFKDDVTVRIRREGGKTKVSVRSRSRVGKLDFGQNARNIREFQAELDRQLGPPPAR
jgi:uncharacterized protein (DUF1499 family)